MLAASADAVHFKFCLNRRETHTGLCSRCGRSLHRSALDRTQHAHVVAGKRVYRDPTTRLCGLIQLMSVVSYWFHLSMQHLFA